MKEYVRGPVLTVLFLLLAGTPSSVLGQQTVAATKSGALDVEMSQSGNVSVDFKDADIRNVLKVLAYKSGVNIIAAPEVVGQVSIQLKDVPWQKALDVILSTYGYSYEQDGKILMVTTIDNLKKRRENMKALAEQEPVITDTFQLSYAKVEDVVKMFGQIKSPQGSVSFDQRTNMVVVTDVKSRIDQLKGVVEKIDTATRQVLIEARIIETTLNKEEKLGMQWPSAAGISSVTFPSRATNFPWSTSQELYLPAMSTSTPAMTYGTISVSELSAMLDFLDTRTNTNMLSNPRVVTLDNQPAEIEVTTIYPRPEAKEVGSSDNPSYIIVPAKDNSYEFGVKFKVTPHINGIDMISLDISPEVSDQVSSVQYEYGDTLLEIPVISKQVTNTNVMVKNGDTLVIAGLIRDKKTKVTDKVPVLGDIPLVGWVLFRHKHDTLIKSELLILITPHIVSADVKTAPAEIATAEKTF